MHNPDLFFEHSRIHVVTELDNPHALDKVKNSTIAQAENVMEWNHRYQVKDELGL